MSSVWVFKRHLVRTEGGTSEPLRALFSFILSSLLFLCGIRYALPSDNCLLLWLAALELLSVEMLRLKTP